MSNNIKKWNEFILEQVDWYVGGAGGVNTNTLPQKTLTDPSLSMDAWDRQQSLLLQAKDQMRWVLQTTFGDPNQIAMIGGDLEKLVINRIFKNPDEITITIHLTFEIDGEEFWGRIEGYNSFQPKLIDEYSGRILDKIVKQRFIGTIFKFIDIFFTPEQAEWKVIADNVRIINEWNMETFIKKGTIVKLGRSWKENGQSIVEVYWKNKTYFIQGLDYFWIRWRMEPIEIKKEIQKIKL